MNHTTIGESFKEAIRQQLRAYTDKMTIPYPHRALKKIEMSILEFKKEKI